MKKITQDFRTGASRAALMLLSAVLLAGSLSGCGLRETLEKLAGEGGTGENGQTAASAVPEGDQNGGTADSPAAVSASSEDSEENSDGGFLEQLARNPLNADKYQDNIPDEESLFRNAATDYFFYNQLTDEEKIIYDAMKTVAGHPESTEYHKRMEIAADPSSDAFKQEVNRAYDALIYDHPEMFWLREGSGSFTYYYLDSFHLGDQYAVMLQLTEPYQNYQAEMTAFNSAVDSFFSDIDTTQAAPWLALCIHDKLNSLVSYDWELADAVTDTGSASFDLSYSAYGALVADSRGDANTALCDGYTYAYQYLLQQVGIPVVRVTGQAGKSADDLQPHSWTVISLDGEWYETDPTWDDIEPDLNSGDADQTIVQAAVSDTAYWNRVRHYMYDLTTEQISNYTADDSYTYYITTDEYSGYAKFLDDSLHIRTTQGEGEAQGDTLSWLAPTATGTTYTYDYLIQNGG